MNLIFFIRSSTVDIRKYTIKDLTGSTGRLDVIARCILAALMDVDKFEKSVQIWVFLDKYGTIVLDAEKLNYSTFPKNELLLCDALVKLLRSKLQGQEVKENALEGVKLLEIDIIDALKQFLGLNYDIFVLSETGEVLNKNMNVLRSKSDLLFLIGSQTGEFISSRELESLSLRNLSLGTKSYLASQVIRLIKLSI